MIYICASAIVKQDEFEVQSIYVLGDDDQGYILTKNGGWAPVQVDMDLKVLVDVQHSQEFYASRLVYSELRTYDDDDAKSFALFVQKQLGDSKKSPEFHKRFFKVLQLIGNKYTGGK